MSTIHFQLFKVLPSREFIHKIAQLYDIKDFDTNYMFTLKNLENIKTVENLNKMNTEISKYYLNCKYNKYMKDLNEKKSITILRHFLRIINYKVESREKYSNNHKYLLYNIKNMNISPDDYELTIEFD
jgi:hypothetical protein